MRKSEASKGLDISLQLEPAVGIDGLILGRLLRTPRAERQDWLRGLLTQGFLAECQARRVLEETSSTEAKEPDRQVKCLLVPPLTPIIAVKLEPKGTTEQTSASPVSLTALRRMIG